MQLAIVGDKLIEASKLDSAYLDYGTFFGDGVYEVLRSYDGKLFALEEHPTRWCGRVGMLIERYSLKDALDLCNMALDANPRPGPFVSSP